MLQQLVWFIHIICALCIIILVLLQHGKGAEIGVAQGSGASQTIFGSKGSGSFLTNLTTIFALIFAITSISLSFFVSQKNKTRTINEMLTQQSNYTEQDNFTDIDVENIINSDLPE